MITINAMDLYLIPRSHPEELNNISLVDRLARLEKKLERMQETVDKNVHNIEELNNIEVKSCEAVLQPAGSSEVEHNLLAANEMSNTQHISDSSTHVPEICVEESVWNGNAKWADVAKMRNFENADQYKHCPSVPNHRGGSRFFGRGRGRGRGMTSDYNKLAVQPVLKLRGSSRSIDACSVDSEGFRLSNYETKKKKQEAKKKQNFVMGKSESRCGIKGAPEPNRDLFIFRLHKDTSDTELKTFITGKGFTVRSLACISNEMAKFKSYRLTVPKSEFSRLFDETLWPAGVGVRKFVPPKMEDKYVDTDL